VTHSFRKKQVAEQLNMPQDFPVSMEVEPSKGAPAICV